MANAINACIIGHILALIAIFLNYQAGIDAGIIAGLLAFGSAYFADQITAYLSQFATRPVPDKLRITALAGYGLSIVFIIISYAVYFAR